MTEKKKRLVSKDEVVKLHRICKRKDIKQIDLRIEFVDHLCELIEEHWEKFPTKSFDQAFHAVYKKFGIFGFLNVVEEHRKIVARRYYLQMWLFIKEWITIPKVFVSFFILLVIYVMGERLNANKFTMIFSLIILGISVIYAFIKKHRIKKEFPEDETILSSGIFHFFRSIYLVYCIMMGANFKIYNHIVESNFMNAVFVWLTLLLSISTLYVIEKFEKLDQELKNQMV